MKRAYVIEKIRKLEAFAAGTKGPESTTARNMAKALAEKYNLSSEDCITTLNFSKTVPLSSIYSKIDQAIIVTIKNHFAVSLEVKKTGNINSLQIDGDKSAVETAASFYLFTKKKLEHLYELYNYSNKRSQAELDSFVLGLYEGLNNRLYREISNLNTDFPAPFEDPNEFSKEANLCGKKLGSAIKIAS